MPTIEFGSRQAANRFRDSPAVKPHLTGGDDRRSTTVRLKRETPQRVIDRGQSRAFETQRQDRASAGMAELSETERRSLERQFPTYSWRQHGFEAMRAKAALQRQGASDWLDFWSPGEGAEGALEDLRRSKQRAVEMGVGGNVGVESRRTDEEELVGGGRQRRRAEAFDDAQVGQARRAAIVEADPQAQDFLRERQMFGEDPFKLRFHDDPDGRGREPLGPTVNALEERHASRSSKAQKQDNRLAAPKTTDPIEWANDPSHLDFPGIDTVGEPVLGVDEPRGVNPPEMDLSDDRT